MSSSTMHSDYAIRLHDVSKVYRLHGSQLDQLIDVLRLQRFGIHTKSKPREFAALDGVTLNVKKGERIGIVGRNGAGKTTLLKLICGNFQQTRGEVEVNGDVQALMSVGLGFHPDYTGRQNVEASLQYNGLATADYERALDGIIDFCELGEFIDQPFKTYSLGMQARLMFAAATAVKPDILIVDEVLGAGDAYFVAKSKSRVERLVGSGCTMLLVSHSMQQVLELCDRAVWMDSGKIRMEGPSFLVVKAYEEYMHGPIRNLGGAITLNAAEAAAIDIGGGRVARSKVTARGRDGTLMFQEPRFVPHSAEVDLPQPEEVGLSQEAPGGISRWDSEVGLKVVGFSPITERGIAAAFVSMQPAEFLIELVAEIEGEFHCRYGVAIHDQMGVCVTRIFSPEDHFLIRKGELRQIRILLNPCQIGPGDYTVGISVLKYCRLELLNSAERYDLLSRSFTLRVDLPESLGSISCNFFHSAEWSFDA